MRGLELTQDLVHSKIIIGCAVMNWANIHYESVPRTNLYYWLQSQRKQNVLQLYNEIEDAVLIICFIKCNFDSKRAGYKISMGCI